MTREYLRRIFGSVSDVVGMRNRCAGVLMWVFLIVLVGCASSDEVADTESGSRRVDSTDEVASEAVDDDETEEVVADVEEVEILQPGERLTFDPNGVQIELSSAGGDTVVSSASEDVCEVEGDRLVLFRAGVCTLEFETEDGERREHVVEVVLADPQLSLTGEIGDLVEGGVGRLVSFTVVSDGAITFESGDVSVCEVTVDGEIVPVSAGPCEVTLAVAESAGYMADSVGLVATVAERPSNEQEQRIEVRAPAEAFTVDDVVELISSSNADLPIEFRAWPETVCSISETGVVSFLGGGTCSVSASNEGNTEFAADRVEIAIGVDRLSPRLSWDNPPVSLEDGESVTLDVDTDSDGEVRFEVVSGDCVLDGFSLTAGGVDECVVVASAEETDRYSTNSVSTEVEVTEKVRTQIDLVWDGVRDLHPDEETTVTVTSTPSVRLSVTTPGVCSITDAGRVEPLSDGTCTVRAFRAADDEYQLVDRVRQINITKRPQTIEIFQWTGFATSANVEPATPLHEFWTPSPFGANVRLFPKSTNGNSVEVVSSGTCPFESLDKGPEVGQYSAYVDWNTVQDQTCTFTAGIEGDDVWADYQVDIRVVFRPFEAKATRTEGHAAVCLAVGDGTTSIDQIRAEVAAQSISVKVEELPSGRERGWSIYANPTGSPIGVRRDGADASFQLVVEDLSQFVGSTIIMTAGTSLAGTLQISVRDSEVSVWRIVGTRVECSAGEHIIGLT